MANILLILHKEQGETDLKVVVFFFNLFIFEREREKERVCVSEQGKGTQREREIGDRIPSRLHAVST